MHSLHPHISLRFTSLTDRTDDLTSEKQNVLLLCASRPSRFITKKTLERSTTSSAQSGGVSMSLQNTKVFVGAGICAVALVFAYWAGRTGREPTRESVRFSTEESPTSLSSSPPAVDAQRLRKLEAAVGTLAQKAARDAELEPVEKPSPPSIPTPEQTAARAIAYRKTMSAIAKSRLDTEARDPSWATEYEHKVAENMARDFPNVSVDKADCRTTICEIRLSSANQADMDQFISNFPASYPAFDMFHFEPTASPNGIGIELHVVRPASGEDFEHEVASTFERDLTDSTL